MKKLFQVKSGLSLSSLLIEGMLALFLWAPAIVSGQKLILMNRADNNKIVNDSTITLFSSDPSIYEITALFTIKNNTDKPLAVFLRKTVNQINDSTTDYFCFYIKCWPDTDTTDVADTIPAGGEDYNFASHVCHKRRFDYPQPVLQPGFSSITYTIFDNTTFPEPVEAKVTVNYHLSLLGTHTIDRPVARVYPNPAGEYLSIDPSEPVFGPCRITVYDMKGSEVLNQLASSSGEALMLETRQLPSGIYSGKVIPGNESPFVFRFIKK